MKNSWHLALLLLLGGMTLESCANTDANVAGTGSQTGNTVVSGVLLDAHARPVSGALVRIRPLTWADSIVTQSSSPYNQACIKDTVTDASGRYHFSDVYSGKYRIEARKDGLASILGVSVGTHPVQPALPAPTHTASLVGEVSIDDTTRSGRIEIYGLARSIALPDTGHEFHFRLDSLPPGKHTLRVWSQRYARSLLEISVTLISGSTTKLEDTTWSREPAGPDEDDY